MKFTELIEQDCNHIKDILISKNQDYAGDKDPFYNLTSCEKRGIASTEVGFLVRMSDKFNRLENLLKQDKEPNNESINDTLSDIAGYAIMFNLYIKYGKSIMHSEQ